MLPTVNRILYSTALSNNAEHTLAYVAQLVKLTGAEVHILHVIKALSHDAVVVMQTYLDDDESPKKIARGRIEKAKQDLQQRHDAFWQSLPEPDRELRQRVAGVHVYQSADNPAEEILKKAAELNCDLIIMGAHERGFMHKLLGSVSGHVLRRARVATLVVPPPKENTKR